MKIKSKMFKSIAKLPKKKLSFAKKLAKKGLAAKLLKKGGPLAAAKKVLPKLIGAAKKAGVLQNDKVLGVVSELISGARNKKELAGVVKTVTDSLQTVTIPPNERSGFMIGLAELAAKTQAQLQG